MDGAHRVARASLDEANRTFVANLEGVSLEEALDTGGGYRSILGSAKHVAGWSAVYHSYAFDAAPRDWEHTDWPRDLRDRIEPTRDYLEEILAWFRHRSDAWLSSLDGVGNLEEARPVHWGEMARLDDIVAMAGAHWAYHAGEINAILAIRRGEAWEYGEEVEENHVSTAGHGVRPAWMTDEQANAHVDRPPAT